MHSKKYSLKCLRYNMENRRIKEKCSQGEAEMDEEGKQTMRVLARNMSFLIKSIALGREQFGLPKTEEHVWTHFI